MNLTDAIVDLLAETLSFPIGDGEAPTGVGWAGVPNQSRFVGYAVVHSLTSGHADGPIDEPNSDLFPVYQVSAYGARRDQCEAIQQQCRNVLVSDVTALDVDGFRVVQVSIETLGGARRDDTANPPLWVSAERYALMTTPA